VGGSGLFKRGYIDSERRLYALALETGQPKSDLISLSPLIGPVGRGSTIAT